MSRLWRLRGKEGTPFFKGSCRNPENREIGRTTITYCAAQTIPSDILCAILSYVPQDALAATIASCTLVCRFWTAESSALLFRRSVIRCNNHRDPSFYLVFCGCIVCRCQREHVNARPQNFCSAALQSHRITFNLQGLEIVGCDRDNCMDILSLKEVVFRMHNLRSLKLGRLIFKPLSSRHRSSLCPRSAQDRRSLDTLVLQGHCRLEATVFETPTVWDVLLWFDRIGCLDISEGLPYGRTMAMSKDSKVTGIKARVHVERLVTDQYGCVTALNVPPPKPRTAPGVALPELYYTDVSGPMDLLDFSCLASLQVLYLTENYFDHFNAFLHKYGSKMVQVECKVIIHPYWSPSPHPKCPSFAHAPIRKCTFTYQMTISPYSRTSDYTRRSLTWNRLLKAFVASPFLEELTIGFRLRFPEEQPDVDLCLSFWAALDWSPLDRLTEGSTSALPPLNVQVALWCQNERITCHDRPQPWKAVTSQFRDFIAPTLPPFARTIVSFKPDG